VSHFSPATLLAFTPAFPAAEKIWRIDLMGHPSTRKNVILFLSALETILKSQGFTAKAGAAV
jgi:aspartate aminotransferase-like enzyme